LRWLSSRRSTGFLSRTLLLLQMTSRQSRVCVRACVSLIKCVRILFPWMMDGWMIKCVRASRLRCEQVRWWIYVVEYDFSAL
jgi:hypothetical protein